MKLLMRTALPVLMLSQAACVNTMQAYIDKNLPQLKPYPLNESLLAAAFDDNSLTGEVEDQVQYFPRDEEEIAQKAINYQSGYVTTWNNAEYGELKFRPGNQFEGTVNGQPRRCKHYSVSWIETQYYGIFKHKQTGDACFNPQTKRWQWVNIVD
jgi:hypothetical protein